MAFAPLQLRGALSIDAADVSDQVTAFMFKASADDVEVPATFGVAKSFLGGNDEYEVDISYLQDQDAEALTVIFWDKIGETITLSGTLREGAESATNPAYAATAVVSSVGMGGKVNAIGEDSVTFKLTGKPVKTTGA